MQTNTNNLLIIKSTIILYLFYKFNFFETVSIVLLYTVINFFGNITIQSIEQVYYESTGIGYVLSELDRILTDHPEIVIRGIYYCASIFTVMLKLVKRYVEELEPIVILGMSINVNSTILGMVLQITVLMYKLYKNVNLVFS